MTTNVTRRHREAFDAVRDRSSGNIPLFSCLVGGRPAAAIVAANQDGGECYITPLFVSVTAAMRLTGRDGSASDAG